ncbi:MAG: hypothetical protein KTR20_06875 [Cellvibrionaceae bacterium]|nr:hypothetical protein [Cellvibrionaceae bacterium]
MLTFFGCRVKHGMTLDSNGLPGSDGVGFLWQGQRRALFSQLPALPIQGLLAAALWAWPH